MQESGWFKRNDIFTFYESDVKTIENVLLSQQIHVSAQLRGESGEGDHLLLQQKMFKLVTAGDRQDHRDFSGMFLFGMFHGINAGKKLPFADDNDLTGIF